MWRDDAYLLDMLIATRKALSFTEGVAAPQFLSEEVRQQAVMRLIQIIGEAAGRVSSECRAAHPEIPWAEIIAMRHRLVHDYFHIIPEKVWEVVEVDLPALVQALCAIVPPDVPSENDR
jgi:uncharacterized protein with HEPN domain